MEIGRQGKGGAKEGEVEKGSQLPSVDFLRLLLSLYFGQLKAFGIHLHVTFQSLLPDFLHAKVRLNCHAPPLNTLCPYKWFHIFCNKACVWKDEEKGRYIPVLLLLHGILHIQLIYNDCNTATSYYSLANHHNKFWPLLFYLFLVSL